MKLARSLIAVAMVAQASAPSQAADRFDDVRQEIRKALTDTRTPSMAVAVAQDGQIVWQEGFGWADQERHQAATEHTAYPIASLSKPITATAAMKLVEAGKLDLRADPNDLLDGGLRARAGGPQLALEHLLNHTSGLPMHYQTFFSDESTAQPTWAQTMARYGSLTTQPGERFQYPNLGFGALSQVIARRTGDYPAFVEREVFAKLGMRDSCVRACSKTTALAVKYENDGDVSADYSYDAGPDATMRSSAHDLIRFALFQLKHPLRDQERVLSDATIDRMQSTSVHTNWPLTDYGLGWQIKQAPWHGYRLLYHVGAQGGGYALLRMVPERGIAVVVLSNSQNAPVPEISDRILRTVLPDWKVRTPSEEAPPSQLAPALAGEWRGTVDVTDKKLPLALSFTSSGEATAQVDGHAPVKLQHLRFDNGWLEATLAGEIPTQDSSRRTPYELQLLLKQRGEILNGSVATVAHTSRGNAISYWAELARKR